MDVACFYHEFIIPVSRDRAFKAMVVDVHNLMPKLLPLTIESMSFICGNGGAGSIRQTVFTEASGLAGGGPLLYRTDIFDPENFSQRQTLIRGGLLFDNIQSVVYEVKYEPLGGDRCICKLATEYHPKEGVRVKEEDINSGKRTTIGFYQAIVDYLVANTDAYA